MEKKSEYSKKWDQPSQPSQPSPMGQGNDSSPSQQPSQVVTGRHSRHAEDLNLMSMADSLGALAQLPTPQGLEGLDAFYSILTPTQMSEAGDLLKSVNAEAYKVVAALVALRKVSIDKLVIDKLVIDKLVIGDRVLYVGTDENLKKQYDGILRVHEIGAFAITCLLPNGSLSSWIDIEDLQLLA